MSTFRGRDDGDLRKLPVYLLLDCSASMSGSPIQAVNQGVGTIYTELCNNPRALSTVKLSRNTLVGTLESVRFNSSNQSRLFLVAETSWFMRTTLPFLDT